MDIFPHIHKLNELKFKNLFEEEGFMPLSYLFFSLCRSFSDSFFFLQFIHASIVNTIIFLFIKKNTPFVFCSIMIFIVWSYLEFNTEIIRESLAVCTFLIGTRYLIKKHWVGYYIYCLIALGFHVSAIISFVIPFVYFLRKNWVVLAICVALMTLSTAVYNFAPELLVYLDLLGSDSSLFEARYFSDNLELKNWHALVLYLIKWVCFPLFSYWLIQNGKYRDMYPYFGCIAVMLVLSSFARYSYAFFRLNNYIMPFIWVMCGLALRSLPSVFKVFSKLVMTHIVFYLALSISTIYIDHIVTKREDMKKYFPYVSIFNKKEISRPEW